MERTQPTVWQRLHYAFDNSMSRGPAMLIAWLALASTLFIAAMSALIVVAGVAPDGEDGTRPGFVDLAWMALMRTLDAGTMGGDQGSWAFLLSMLVVTFGGIFVISTFIGAITGVIEQKIDELRKGRSQALENDHTVILGWSPHVFTVVSEICAANANKPKASIVVLAEKDKVEMEDELRERVEAGPTRIVCRTGSPTDIADLDIANVQRSRAIVVLPPEGVSADATVIKTLLAITNNPDRRSEPYHIVAPIQEARNLEVARLVGRDEAELILVGDLLARITVQTCRQSGLSVVYLELLDFGGDEIYFHEEPKLVGRTFGDALTAYEDSAIIGLRPAQGGPLLNPPMDTKIGPGDKVIAISEDDDTVRLAPGAPQVDGAAIVDSTPPAPQPERTLVLGFNALAPAILRELAAYVAAGSEAIVVSAAEDAAARVEAACPDLPNLACSFEPGDVTDRRVLDRLDIPSFDHVILLSEEGWDEQDADGRTLMTLLHLRDIRERSGRDVPIVSEIRDLRNRRLAEVTRADDFIVGDRLASLLLSQIAENKELNAVFADLFDPEGSEVYLKPAEAYVRLGTPVTFHTIVEAARRRGEVAFGYRTKAEARDAGKAYGVRVNPKKSERVSFAAGDRIVVLAES